MTAEPIGFFVHLQKTGGTALFQRLRDGLGAAAVYPGAEDHGDVGSTTDVERLREAFAVRRSELRVVTGHFPLCTTELLDGPFRTFTVLRDPVERTLSLLRRRQVADERYRGWDLVQIYEQPALEPVIRNHMVKMLSMDVAEMGQVPLTTPVHLGPERLDRAKENLETIEVVGLQERFEEFCTVLAHAFGWDLGAPRFANRTQQTEVSPSLRDRIAEDNALDVGLYEFARAVVAQRRAAAQGAHGG